MQTRLARCRAPAAGRRVPGRGDRRAVRRVGPMRQHAWCVLCDPRLLWYQAKNLITLSVASRPTCTGHGCLLHASGHSRTPDGPYPACASTTLPSSHTDRSPIIHAATTTAAGAHKAPSIDYRGAHECPHHAVRAAVWSSARHHVRAWDANPDMGHEYREAREGVPQGKRQGRNLWRRVPPGRAGGVRLE